MSLTRANMMPTKAPMLRTTCDQSVPAFDPPAFSSLTFASPPPNATSHTPSNQGSSAPSATPDMPQATRYPAPSPSSLSAPSVNGSECPPLSLVTSAP